MATMDSSSTSCPAPDNVPTVYYSTYLGGKRSDIITAIAVSAQGDATVAGYTNSGNFRTTIGVVQPIYAGDRDAFVTKISTQ